MIPFTPEIHILDGFDDTVQYSDGESEDTLYKLFAQEDPQAVQADITARLSRGVDWAELVHLSPQRHNLLNWYHFRNDSRLLELGAGCGALTGLFAERVAQVDTIDLSLKRTQILAQRHRHWGHICPSVGTLRQFSMHTKTKYDYITCIGVLEYAGRYIPSPGHVQSPYIRFLQDAASLLSPGGVFLLAIENQFGSKYLSGCAEDHYGEPLVGIEDYPDDAGIRTFGKHELETLIRAAGMIVQNWYYPFPDYKLPHSIYTDDMPLGSVSNIAQLYPSPDIAFARAHYFDEGRFMYAASRNRFESLFANSFLVECTL